MIVKKIATISHFWNSNRIFYKDTSIIDAVVIIKQMIEKFKTDQKLIL